MSNLFPEMLDNVQTEFSIRDLEQLTGVSVHTIRIWERRFGLLSPDRSGTNIRRYGTDDLKRLISISDLRQSGIKISDIARLSKSEIQAKLDNLKKTDSCFDAAVSNMKLSMLDYNTFLFEKTWRELSAEFSFEKIFLYVLLPLLNQVGLLWQTGSISPSNEHFLSNLVRQKLFINIERVSGKKADDELFVLFLPSKEIHEIGLLFVHYTLLESGRNSIYLGSELDYKELTNINKSTRKKITYVTYWTIDTGLKSEANYLKDFNKLLLTGENELFITGGKSPLQHDKLFRSIHCIGHPGELLKTLTEKK